MRDLGPQLPGQLTRVGIRSRCQKVPALLVLKMAAEWVYQVKGSPLGDAVTKQTDRVGQASLLSPESFDESGMVISVQVRPLLLVRRMVLGGSRTEQTPGTGQRTEVNFVVPYAVAARFQVRPPSTVVMTVALAPTAMH